MPNKKVKPGGEVVQSGQSGQTVFVCASKFSKAFSLHAAKDFRDKYVLDAGQIRLPDGQIIKAGQTYKTITSPELTQMIRSGVLQASASGKL